MPTHRVTVGITLPDVGDEVKFSLVPRKVIVPNAGTEGEETILEWVIPDGQGTFHATNPFTWNSGSTDPEPPKVTRHANNLLRSAPYRNDVQGSLTWAYTVRLNNGVNAVAADPEVDNLPPLP